MRPWDKFMFGLYGLVFLAGFMIATSPNSQNHRLGYFQMAFISIMTCLRFLVIRKWRRKR